MRGCGQGVLVLIQLFSQPSWAKLTLQSEDANVSVDDKISWIQPQVLKYQRKLSSCEENKTIFFALSFIKRICFPYEQLKKYDNKQLHLCQKMKTKMMGGFFFSFQFCDIIKCCNFFLQNEVEFTLGKKIPILQSKNGNKCFWIKKKHLKKKKLNLKLSLRHNLMF